MTTNIIFSGVGGQGIIVASDIFCEAALSDGWDVAKAEVHGMAQRGGSIVAHVRVGKKVQAPLIETGNADIIVGFEMLETARVLPMLKKNGTVMLNTKYLLPSISNGVSGLSSKQLLDLIKNRTSNVYEIDGTGIANKLGNTLTVNMLLLGALSSATEKMVKKESLTKALSDRLKPKHVALNLKAFNLGREQVKPR